MNKEKKRISPFANEADALAIGGLSIEEVLDDKVPVKKFIAGGCCSARSMAEGKIVECFIKLISYHHSLTLQFHRAAGEARVFAAVHEGWQHHEVEAVELCVAAVVVVAAEADLDCGGGGKQFGNIAVVPEKTVTLVGGFRQEWEVANDDYLFTEMFRLLKPFLQPSLLPGAHCTAVVVQFGVCIKVGKELAIFLCFRRAEH